MVRHALLCLYSRRKMGKKLYKKGGVIILTYYWPPSGGSGVQRWMYFSKYLKELGWEPFVITVDEKKASYPVLDMSLEKIVKNIKVIKTSTNEPLKLFSFLTTGGFRKGIPQGEVKNRGLFNKLSNYLRANCFIPDARVGWVNYAYRKCEKIIIKNNIRHVITTGPPHSSHLIGLKIKKDFKINWTVDFRDPWVNIFYNKQFLFTEKSINKQKRLEKEVLNNADLVLTTIGGDLKKQLQLKAPNQNFAVVPNGYDSVLINKIKGKKSKKYFHIVYTGLLTRNHPYLSFLKNLKQNFSTVNLKLSLAGNISHEIINEIKNFLPNFKVKDCGYLNHEDTVRLIKSADLLVNFFFIGGEKEMISGKIMEYLATKIPILSIGDPKSEAGKILSKASQAKMFLKDSDKEIEQFLKKVILNRGKLINSFPNLDNWSRKKITKKLSNLLSEL